MVVAAAVMGGAGSARGSGLRPAPAVAATGGRGRLLDDRYGHGRPDERKDDALPVQRRLDTGGGRRNRNRCVGEMTAGTSVQSGRGGQPAGEEGEGGDMASAHVYVIGSLPVRRNPRRPGVRSVRGGALRQVPQNVRYRAAKSSGAGAA